ncbi:MAG: HAD-IIIC family phosphatase [Lachnospiraceae bacterium]|nr:HAD-IIIC family phosphatase [Lachnospiraceae bacterium]
MASFLELKKAAKNASDHACRIRISLAGDCATQHLVTAIKGAFSLKGINADIYEAEYDAVSAELLDPGSGLFLHDPEFIILVLCTEKLYDAYCRETDREGFAKRHFEKIKTLWDRALSVKDVKLLQTGFIPDDDGVYGNLSGMLPSGFLYQTRMLNLLLADEAMKRGNVHILELQGIMEQFGRAAFKDDKLWYAARMPYSMEALPGVAFLAVRRICALRGDVKKCVILDLDGTLWGGVIGDDGLAGIELGELGTGRAYKDVQRFLKELKKRGIILAVCSKNDEDKAMEPFIRHPDMVLKPDDIACFIANWEDKASNIKKIQEILNIGFDSMVFLDDNPFERELVKNFLPEVTVPELPEDAALYLSFLKQSGLFEAAGYGGENESRTRQYREETLRVKERESFNDYDEYLKSLGMEGHAAAFDDFNIPRISELTLRSNQFNLRTVRYSAEDIRRVAEDPSYITLYFKLKDRFGDHGLISVMIMKKEEDTLFIDTLLMSCRVLKRGVESFILNKAVETGKKAGFKFLKGEYIPTKKNGMVKDLYESMGFEKKEDGSFILNMEAYVPNKVYIKEI